MSKAVTARQLAVLRYIDAFIGENGYAPSIRELGAYFEIRTLRGATAHLAALHAKGLVSRNSAARSLAVTPEGRLALGQCADPAMRLHALEAAVKRYRRLCGEYGVRCFQALPSERTAMATELREALEDVFRLVDDDGGGEKETEL